ncbi:MAG: dihydropteroate synthase [Candidatus Melainabacteria bacterium]|nr:dihydropteroate synthase [Candidatus Melainabacteria bacterium]
MVGQFAILNITPDSFSDGNESNLDASWSVAKAKELLQLGADFVDIGAESTRPGASFVSTEQEWSRLRSFLEVFDSELQGADTVLSLDSRNPQVIKQVFQEYGKKFAFLNDVTGLQNRELLKVLADHIDPSVKLITMHSKGGVPPSIKAAEIRDDFYEMGLLEDLKRFWDQTITACQEFGIDSGRLVLDPGLGFGKNLNHSLEILELIPKLKQEFALPILIGASRKSFLALWQPGKDLDELTLEYNELCKQQGVDYSRNHVIKAGCYN